MPSSLPVTGRVHDRPAIVLARGHHDEPPEGCDDPERCFFEWYNWLTRGRHTDACLSGVSPVLYVFGIRLNDALPGGRRQELKRFLPNGEDRLAGTADDGKDECRSYIALDWLIRTYTPAWLDLGGLTAEATALRDLRRIADLVAAQTAGPVVRGVSRKAAQAAWDAAGAAARAAARDAAGAAARAAARDAADAAADAAARVAADAAARDAADAAAWDAAWDAARDAARAAARDAASAAASAAARAAADKKLAPTVAELEVSAIALFDVLITGEWPGKTNQGAEAQ